MAQPERDDAAVHASVQEGHGRGVAEGMGRDPLEGERRAALRSGGCMAGHEPLDGVVAEASAAGARKDRLVGRRREPGQPRREDAYDIATQWCASELPALAAAAEVSAGTEHDVGAAQADQLRHAQARLDRDEQQCSIALSDPGAGVGGVEEGRDLLVGEELHAPALEALGGDRQRALTAERMSGLVEGDIAEEGVERREASVTAAGAIAPFPFEMLEEGAEEGSIEIGEDETGGGAAQARGGEAEEQAEGVAVGGHGVGAGRPFAPQAFGEEGFQEGGELGSGHGLSSSERVTRSVASCRSSGTASMYQ